MNWTALFDLVKKALEHFVGDVQKADKWKVSVDGKRSGPVTHVTVGSAGITFDFTHAGASVKLQGKPDASDHAIVLVNGVPDPGAHMTFSTRSQPLNGRPLILVFEFVGVTLAGAKHRIRFDCPK